MYVHQHVYMCECSGESTFVSFKCIKAQSSSHYVLNQSVQQS